MCVHACVVFMCRGEKKQAGVKGNGVWRRPNIFCMEQLPLPSPHLGSQQSVRVSPEWQEVPTEKCCWIQALRRGDQIAPDVKALLNTPTGSSGPPPQKKSIGLRSSLLTKRQWKWLLGRIEKKKSYIKLSSFEDPRHPKEECNTKRE